MISRLGALVLFVLALGCTEDLQLGGLCAYDSDCPSGLVCGFGRCRAECRQSVDCDPGAMCLVDEMGVGSCSVVEDVCERDEQCQGGLRCALGRCVDACEVDGDCAQGDQCWSVPSLDMAICVDPRARPEAGMPVELDGGAEVPDAGVDGGPSDAGIDGGTCRGPACDPVRRVALGWQHACAVTESGRLWCWGRDVAAEASGVRPDAPECGIEYCRARPVEVLPFEEGRGAVDVALGDSYSCALMEDGSIQCWGGARPTPEALTRTPALVELPPNGEPVRDAIAIRAGRRHLLFELAEGIYGAGEGTRGELQGADGPTPVRIDDRPTSSRFAAGAFFSCSVESGVASCWGSNRFRQLGRAEPMPAEGAFDPQPSPVESIGIGAVVDLVVGGQHACAEDADAVITCWGHSRDASPTLAVPARVITGGAVLRDLASASSADHQLTCARSETSPSRAYCWGRPSSPSFYPAGTVDTTRAVAMWPSMLGDVSQVATDGATACVVSGGDVLCWGDNSAGQLAQGDGAAHDGPVRVRW
ncbi:RCC1 domain-containing protein [Sandaracinus amylolyticus]|uniref:BNR repeat domain protein n=1 Tax=Sandaracinus amylolyticus TaxID=927083 RepID=A0A0F6W389_9BACT|nr:hypothetical protein [Sandaracinus amylolyticus]AKF06368.1 BNR repeat domain protein [Sandaracinus amylolyticus]